jgi:hypothetical protein
MSSRIVDLHMYFAKKTWDVEISREVMPLNELGPQGRVMKARWLPHFSKTCWITWLLDLDTTSSMKNPTFLADLGRFWWKPTPRFTFECQSVKHVMQDLAPSRSGTGPVWIERDDLKVFRQTLHDI